MVTLGYEFIFFIALCALSGVAMGFHIIHSRINYPLLGNSAKVLSIINLIFLIVFLVINFYVSFPAIHLFLTAVLVVSNVVVLKQYVR